ncbi:SDR family NAD(P)-dependent oxidoreductase [Lichenibacterium dinghuense]|uniref:SDR family NAD(P)-dependent oxidoreductase n=1 Tax=Lichenibacterium dinghuense TaxID=2895977 RepID=UPI001F36141F|nr:SDR family oxidoreductase [Lichenibacterium sp. 6Y81]
MRNAHRLTDRVALVTGASRGIGRAVAELYAREGATVVVNHWRDAEAAEAAVAALHAASAAEGHPARTHAAAEADVSDAAAVERMFADVAARCGRLHVLVNNAGMQVPTPGEGFDDAAFLRVLGVDLIGPALCSRAALRLFLPQGSGTIINTTSVHELIPKPGYAAYSVAKGGLGNLTRTLALEFASRGIRVNAVGPGAVTTDMNAAWTGDPAARAAVEAHIPMGRAASAEEIATVFAFLASDDARYITGQTVYACGGLTLYGDFATNWAS